MKTDTTRSATRPLDREILAFIQRSQRQMPREAEFQSLAFRLFEHQFERNANYRKFCLGEGRRPGSLSHWKDIPAMPAAGFKELVLAAFPLRDTVKVFKTSGTTRSLASATKAPADTPPRGAHFFDTLKLYEAASIPPFKEFLLPDTQDFFYGFLVSPPEESPHSSLSHMMGVVNRVFAKKKGRFYVKGNEPRYKKLASDLSDCGKKAFLLATAFSLKGFLDYLKSEKIRLKLRRGSRLMETGGFKGRARAVSKRELYGHCEKRLGIEPSFCVSEYGMTELSSQFYDTRLRDKVLGVERKPFLAAPPWVRTLIIDPRTGQEARRGAVGLLRHYDLANRGSVMAVQTEDLGRAAGEGFELLGRAKDSELRGCSLNYEEFIREGSASF